MASYEALMERKLDMIDDRRDKRQGSLIYDALAPNAAETSSFYADLDMQLPISCKMEHDAVGHYARPDVLELKVYE